MMSDDLADGLVKVVSRELEETEEEVEEKVQRIMGEESISRSGAIYYLAQKHDINVEEELKELNVKKIEELEPNMQNITILGRVSNKFEVNTFERKDGSTGRVANLLIFDDTDEARASFWDDKINKFREIGKGDLIKITNAYTKTNRGKIDINLNYRSRVILNPEDERTSEIPESKDQIKPKDYTIDDIPSQKSGINLIGRVHRKFEIKEFKREDGVLGKVGSLALFDDTGTIRTTFWDDRIDDFKELEENDVIRIENAYSTQDQRGLELHVGEKGEVIQNPDDKRVSKIPLERSSKTYEPTTLENLEIGNHYEVKGTITILNSIGYFRACPKCMSSVKLDKNNEWVCDKHGTVRPLKRVYVNFGLDDGNAFVRGAAFGNTASSLLNDDPSDITGKFDALTEEMSREKVEKKIASEYKTILGSRIKLKGTVREEETFGKQILADTIIRINEE